jgi:acyl-CoA synthetase (AMP-forming)/AMP-acid ligase II
VVAVQVPNSAEQPIAHLALNRIGALAMPVHESWHEAELPHLLKLGKAVAAIVLSSYRDLDYPAIYAVADGVVSRIDTHFANGGNDRYGLDLMKATDMPSGSAVRDKYI